MEEDPQSGRLLVSLAAGEEKVSASTVSQAYVLGDPLARRLVEDTAKYLAAGISSVVNAVGPKVVVLGGGVVQGLPGLVPIVDNLVRSNALEAATDRLQITTTTLGAGAVALGAASLARDSG
jgi:glucokinase